MIDPYIPNRDLFNSDPFGYSALALDRLRLMALDKTGLDIGGDPATVDDLNSPVLWLCMSQAMTAAAKSLLTTKPDFSTFKDYLHGILDSQHCAIALMLIAYSLEISCKGVIVLREGSGSANNIRTHRIQDLVKTITPLNQKQHAIATLLSEHAYWAGRYPSPKDSSNYQQIYSLSEQHQITMHDVLSTASHIQRMCSAAIHEANS